MISERFSPFGDGFANTVAVEVDTHQWPVVLPSGRLQMDHAPQDRCFLEVIEPPAAVGRIDQSSLMRAVDLGVTLFKHNLPFVWTVDVT